MDFGVILAGGKGKRMKANRPKPLFEVLGRPMLEWVIRACEKADVTSLCIIKGFCGEQIDENAIRCFQYYGIENCTVLT